MRDSAEKQKAVCDLEWHKFLKKSMPDGECQILVCRDCGHDPFFVTVTVCCGDMSYHRYDGIHDFVPEPGDRWTYIPYPEGAVKA